MQTRSAEQRLTAVEQRNEDLSRRVELLEHPNRQLVNMTSDNLAPQLSPKRTTQQPHQQPYQQPYQQPSPASYVYSSPAPVQGPMIIDLGGRGNMVEVRSGWQCWSCCMLWFGLSHLLGGVGMLVPGAISLAAALAITCPDSYTVQGSQCCYNYYYYNYSNYCYTPISSATMTSGIVLLCVGFVSAIVGIVLLCKACKFYRNNNETCC